MEEVKGRGMSLCPLALSGMSGYKAKGGLEGSDIRREGGNEGKRWEREEKRCQGESTKRAAIASVVRGQRDGLVV